MLVLGEAQKRERTASHTSFEQGIARCGRNVSLAQRTLSCVVPYTKPATQGAALHPAGWSFVKTKEIHM